MTHPCYKAWLYGKPGKGEKNVKRRFVFARKKPNYNKRKYFPFKVKRS